MVDIKTLVEEAKAAARKHAPNARAIIEAIDALAEAHQAEVATLNAEVERVRGICDRDNEMFRGTMQTDLAIREGLQAEVARLTNEAENVRRKWLGHRDTGHLSLVEAADHVVGGLHADIDRLTRENEGLAADLVSIRSAWNTAEAELAAKQDAAPTSERPQVSIPLSENFYIARDQIKREFRRALGLRPDIGHSGQGTVGFGEQCDLVESMLNHFASSAVAAGGQTTAPKPETAPRDLASLEDLQRWLVAFASGAANMNPEFSVIRRWTNALVSVTGRAVPRGWED